MNLSRLNSIHTAATRIAVCFALWLGFLASLVPCGVSADAVAAPEDGVKFEKLTLAAAVAKAKTEKKVVMVDFYTTWCGPCKLLDKNVYTDKEFSAYASANFISIKLDAEKEGASDAQTYRVRAYPSVVFIDGDGKEIDRVVGYDEPKAYLENTKRASSGKNKVEFLLEEDKAAPTIESKLALVKKYQGDGNAEQALVYLKAARSLAEKERHESLEDLSFVLARMTLKDGLSESDMYLKKFPSGKYVADVYTLKSFYYQGQGDVKAQQKWIDKMLDLREKNYKATKSDETTNAYIQALVMWTRITTQPERNASAAALSKGIERVKLAKTISPLPDWAVSATLADLYFRTGKAADAVREGEAALQLAPDEGGVRPGLLRQLESYREAQNQK